MVTHNGRNRRVSPLVQTARGYTKSVVYFSKMGNFDLAALSVQADFDEISEVWAVSVSRQEGIERIPLKAMSLI